MTIFCLEVLLYGWAALFVGFGILQGALAIVEFDLLRKGLDESDQVTSYLTVLAVYNLVMCVLYMQTRLVRSILKKLSPCHSWNELYLNVNVDLVTTLFVPPALIRIPVLLFNVSQSIFFVELVVFYICVSLSLVPFVWRIGWTFCRVIGHPSQ